MKTTKFLTSAFVLGSIALGTLGQAQKAAAATIYRASDANNDQYRSPADHSFVFFNNKFVDNDNNEKNPIIHGDFSFLDNGRFKLNDKKAHLRGTIAFQEGENKEGKDVINQDLSETKRFQVDLLFDLLEKPQGEDTPTDVSAKRELDSAVYDGENPLVDDTLWKFFTFNSKSSITELGGDWNNNGEIDKYFLVDASEKYKGQYGSGANGKNIRKGFSQWFFIVNEDNRSEYNANGLENLTRGKDYYYGDININLTDIESVPEPATMSLLTLGLLGTGMGALKRKNK